MAYYSGEALRLSVFGESRGDAVGLRLEGLPEGLSVDLPALQCFLDRRAPGRNPWSSTRKEPDQLQLLSGLCQGMTTGEPLTVLLANKDAPQKTPRTVLRPGHADWPAYLKYGEIPAGGGKFSGRLTAPLCVAGGICLQLLRQRGIRIGAHILSVSGVSDTAFDPMMPELSVLNGKAFPVLDDAAGRIMIAEIEAAKAAEDSVGGTVECAVVGLPAGLGDHLWDGTESRLAPLLFGIPGVRGLFFGNGFAAAKLRGSENNDPLYLQNGSIIAHSNRHGGILGGMTTGLPLLFTAAFKPTPSIGAPQNSVDISTMTETTVCTCGRNDPCIVPRAVPVVEAAAAIVIYDLLRSSAADSADGS